MSRKKKIIIGILCAVLIPIVFICMLDAHFTSSASMGIDALIVYLKATSPYPVEYELTDEEKEWLTVKFGDEERIEKGRLYEDEEKQLKMAREGLSVLEEKYPGYHFRITWLNRFDTWTNFTVYEEATGEEVIMNVEEDDESGYEVTDNFYEYFFADKYAAYIEEWLNKKGIDEVIVETAIYRVAGKEYDINMTVEDVMSGKLEIAPCVYVKMYISDMSEAECMEYAQKLQNIIEEANLCGVYMVYFRNVTKEEMLSTGEEGDLIYKYNFQLFERKEKE